MEKPGNDQEQFAIILVRIVLDDTLIRSILFFSNDDFKCKVYFCFPTFIVYTVKSGKLLVFKLKLWWRITDSSFKKKKKVFCLGFVYLQKTKNTSVLLFDFVKLVGSTQPAE